MCEFVCASWAQTHGNKYGGNQGQTEDFFPWAMEDADSNDGTVTVLA